MQLFNQISSTFEALPSQVPLHCIMGHMASLNKEVGMVILIVMVEAEEGGYENVIAIESLASKKKKI